MQFLYIFFNFYANLDSITSKLLPAVKGWSQSNNFSWHSWSYFFFRFKPKPDQSAKEVTESRTISPKPHTFWIKKITLQVKSSKHEFLSWVITAKVSPSMNMRTGLCQFKSILWKKGNNISQKIFTLTNTLCKSKANDKLHRFTPIHDSKFMFVSMKSDGI